MRGEFVAVPVDLVDGAAGQDGDALLFHLGTHVVAHVFVKTAQDVVAAIDQGHVGAEAGKDAGEFQRDVAAALNDDAPGQFLEVKHLVGGDDVLDAGDRLPVIGGTAGGDQDVFCGQNLAAGETHRVRVHKFGARLDDPGAGLF